MDLELGLKLTRNAADEFSSANFQLLKDHRGHLFQSRETDTMFILTAHLKGYERGDIKIDINEDGSVIAISGEKPVEETIMVGFRLYKKGIEIKKLRKSFRIPDGVFLDEIKAEFDDDEAVLTVELPKRVHGIVGTLIEEMVENQECALPNYQVLDQNQEIASPNDQILDHNQEIASSNHQVLDKIQESDLPNDQVMDQNQEMDSPNHQVLDQIQEMALPNHQVMDQKQDDKVDQETIFPNQMVEEQSIIQESPRGETELKQEQVEPKKHDKKLDKAESSGTKQQTDEGEMLPKSDEILEDESEIDEEEEGEDPGKKCKFLCAPIVAGSALLLSFVVFVIQFIRTKNQSAKTKS